MVDFSGGGVVGMDVNGWMGNQPNAVGGMTGGQIDTSIGMGAGGAGAVNQATLNNLYGPQGFGGQTAYYAGVGADYSRQVAPSSPAAVAAANGGYNYIDAGGGGGGSSVHNPWGDDAGTADWGSQPISPPASAPPASFNDRFTFGGAYSGMPPEIMTGRSAPTGAGPTSLPQTFDGRWPSLGAPPAPEDGSLYYSAPSSAHNPWGGVSPQEEAAMRAYAARPGQAYGPGYFDNTFGTANENQSQQAQRDAIARATIQQQQSQGRQTPSAVFGGFGAENMWRDPFANSQRPVGNLSATGIYQDPFGGYNSSNAVGPWGLSNNLAKPDYQYGGFGDDNQVFGPSSLGGG